MAAAGDHRLVTSLSSRTRFGYALGVFSFSVKDVAFGSFVLFYYVSVVGLPGRLAGLVIFLSLVWDAISDPLVGSISDNLRSRWGRRHPLMLIGGIPLGASLMALFHVPQGLGDSATFVWMLVCCLAVRTFITLYTVPYLALGAELSTDYQERSNISGLRTALGWLVGILLTAFSWMVLFTGTDDTDGRLIATNYQSFGWLAFALIALFTSISTASTWHTIPSLPSGADTPQPFSVRAIFRDVAVALTNRNFRMLFLLMLSAGLATGLNASLGTHMNTYFWELSTQQLAIQALSGVVIIVGMIVLMPVLNRRLEKQRVTQLTILVLVLNTLWFVPGRLLGLIPENSSAWVFPLVLVHGYVGAAAVLWFQAMSGSIIADIADEQELATGQRQEGMFFAAQGFSIKFVTGIGTLLGGLIIDAVGLVPGAAPGSVSEPVLTSLGLVMGPGIALFLLIPYLISRQLRLGAAQHQEIRSALDRRAVNS